jgi:reverse gyrase
MNIPDEVLSVIKCCLSQNKDHFVKDAYILSCGGNCCKKCIEDSKKRHNKCNFCHELHSKEELKYLSANPSVEIMINTFSKDIIHYIKREFEKTYRSAQGSLLSSLSFIE